MTDDIREPVRLRAGDDAAARLLEVAAHDGPSPGDLAALAAKIGVPPAGGPPPAPLPPLASTFAVGAAVCAAITAAIFGLIAWLAPAAPIVSPPASASAAAPIVAPSSAPIAVSTALPVEPSAPPSSARATVISPRSPITPAPSVAPIAADEPAASGSIGAEVETEPEAAYLARAQDALRSSPATALALADAYPRRYPHGVLGQEREVIAIEALVRLGRTDAARSRADAFRHAYPTSAHARRLAALLPEAAPADSTTP